MGKKLFGRRDLVLLAVFLLIGGAALLFQLARPSAAGGVAEVSVDGEPVAALPLSEDGEMVIEGYGGGENTLVIRDGEADIVAATCPDGVCVRHRPVSREGESIICLPNRVVVTIRGGKEAAVDGVT